jgi:hypothetical protein
MGRQDFSRPWLVCNSTKTEQKGGESAGSCRNQILNENTSKWMSKHQLFDNLSEVQKDSKDISAERVFWNKSGTL